MRSKHESPRRGTIRAWLRGSRRKLVAAFTARAAAESRSEDGPLLKRGRRLGALLRELAVSLRRGRVVHEPIAWSSASGATNRRGKKALDLDTVIREIAILRDCVLDGVAASAPLVAIAEARVAIDWFDAVAGDAREARVAARVKKVRDQNQRLLVLFDVLLDAIEPMAEPASTLSAEEARRQANRLSVIALDLRAIEDDEDDERDAVTARKRFSCLPGGNK